MRFVASASRILGPNAALIVPPIATGSNSSPALSAGSPANSAAPTPAVPVTQLFQSWQTNILGAPLFWLAMLVLFLVAWKLIEEHRGGEAAFSKIRVDGTNVVKTGSMALLFIIVVRYFTKAYTIPGISPLVQAYG